MLENINRTAELNRSGTVFYENLQFLPMISTIITCMDGYVSKVSSSENILTNVASTSKEQAEDIPLVPGVAGVKVQPNPSDQELYEINDDPAKWPIDKYTRDHICKDGANQNIQNDFPKSERIYKDKARQLSRHLFERQLLNGEKVSRKWLIYSKSTGCVFCGPCLLFNDGESQFDKKKVSMTDSSVNS
ncbi:zinc finger MYM-type protein 5-like [Bactrocera neohumeralis]|uniref:zinc finger MYM-type protein 5-like n=1 Tax=Bactrocera neohumeralis TaxID=98809 RepID=UPI0021652C00|nr:zinc finger MYM-type protein 5-like [Bactrocera neohumeralis]